MRMTILLFEIREASAGWKLGATIDLIYVWFHSSAYAVELWHYVDPFIFNNPCPSLSNCVEEQGNCQGDLLVCRLASPLATSLLDNITCVSGASSPCLTIRSIQYFQRRLLKLTIGIDGKSASPGLFYLTSLRLVINLGQSMFLQKSIDLICIPQMMEDLSFLSLTNGCEFD